MSWRRKSRRFTDTWQNNWYGARWWLCGSERRDLRTIWRYIPSGDQWRRIGVTGSRRAPAAVRPWLHSKRSSHGVWMDLVPSEEILRAHTWQPRFQFQQKLSTVSENHKAFRTKFSLLSCPIISRENSVNSCPCSLPAMSFDNERPLYCFHATVILLFTKRGSK